MKNSKLVAAMCAAAMAVSMVSLAAFANAEKEDVAASATTPIDADVTDAEATDAETTDDETTDAETTDGETTDGETTDGETTADEYTTGDADGNGKIDVTDIAVTASHIKGIKALNAAGSKAADANHDGNVDVGDIAAMAAHIKGIKALG